MAKIDKPLLINRELSWLSFNARVLQEANDASVPLIERLRFLGIFSSNRDEFFRVRVATIRRMIKLSSKTKSGMDIQPEALLEKITAKVLEQQEIFEETYQNLLRELELNGIYMINETQLSAEQGEYVKQYFREKVMPSLFPIMLDQVQQFPWLKDRAIYLFIKLEKADFKTRYALVEIPTDKINRFLVLPKENKYIILLDDIIRYCLHELFFSFSFTHASAYTIKMTRDAELDIEMDVSKSLVKKVSESIKRRKKGDPVRLEFDEDIPADMLKFLSRKLKFLKQHQIIRGGRYHNFVDFINFPQVGKSELRYKHPKPLQHPLLSANKSLIKTLKHRDILLSYPYQSFHYLIDLLREAAIDPKVESIQITLYRVAKNSDIVNALISAIKNGKQVTAVVELQARFDEERNIYWSNRLQEEGAKVIYGVPGLKVHTKLILITRMEHGQRRHYAHLGTGNFNEDTAKIYCDHSLFTSDKRLTRDVADLFNFYSDNYKTGNYQHLLAAPFTLRKRIIKLIEREIKHKKQGKESWIFWKMNSLVDEEIIRLLYDASRAGVKIRLIIRGICSLVPGVKGLSENIEAISIVDKYLEHARVLVFCNDGKPEFFIASSDMMTRNLDFRSEVAAPVYDRQVQKELMDILEIQWRDNVKARVLNAEQNNMYRKTDDKKPHRAQEEIYQYLKDKLVLQPAEQLA